MPRTCTVCTHAEREAIDKALLAGEATRTLAARYGTIGRMALARHKAEHLPGALVKAAEASDVAHGDDLLGQLRGLQERTLAILDRAETAGDLRAALSAIGQARATVALLVDVVDRLASRAGDGELEEESLALLAEVTGCDPVAISAEVQSVTAKMEALRASPAWRRRHRTYRTN